MRFFLLSIVVAASLLVVDASAQLPLIGVTNTMWRYLATGVNPGEDWKHPTFDDSSWPSGRGLFGAETTPYPYPFNTVVQAAGMGGPMTAYYRTRFQWAGFAAGVILKGTNYVDDGCIVYLNGVEISRFNMPEGPVNSSTPALLANPTGEPVALPVWISLDALTNGNANPLVSGENVVAVEVHQNSGTSSDHVFGLSFQTVPDFPCGIIYHPTSQVATACQTVTFTVVPHFECFNPSYQWFFKSPGEQESPLPGANQSILTLPDVQLDDVGYYFCRLVGNTGSIESQWASLTVVPNTNAPAIRYAYADSDEFHVIFDRSIQMQGGNNDPFSWRVYRLPNGPDLNIISAQLTNENEVVIVTAEGLSPDSNYACTTVRNIASRCGDGVLPAGMSVYPQHLYPLIDIYYAQPSPWRYLDTGIDPGPAWNQPSFDDSGWKEGRQPFSSLSGTVAGWPVETWLAINGTNSQRIPTYLFRTRVRNCGPFIQYCIARVMHDDGMALYINGREIVRRGIVDDRFGSFGGTAYDADTTFQQSFEIAATNFITGENVVAVQLKQASPSSGDAVFGMRLDALLIGDPDPSLPVSILDPPQSQTVTEGRIWSIQAVPLRANPCVDYQWYRNGLPLPGATGPRITGVAKPADAGVYYVQLSNAFGSDRSPNSTLQVEPATLSYRASWRYQTNSQDTTLLGTGAPWFAPQFDDSGWPIGEGPFARETTPSTLARMPSPIATPLPAPEPNLQTTYFRTRVTIPEVPAGQTLVLCHTIDDGAAIYVDGQLAHRYNLANALPIYSTNAAAMNVPGDYDAQIVCTPLTLAPGEHLIAVEVHQANPDQSDVYFGLELRLATPPTDLAIKSNSASNYFLQWTTDPFWDLVESTQITGPYSRVSGSGTSPYSLPPPSTNRFYQLRFHGR